jgi:hypothetical protein
VHIRAHFLCTAHSIALRRIEQCSNSGFASAKERLDALMQAELAEKPAFRAHDLRRTVRTKLASLRVSDAVAELIIGHGKKGLQRIYDQHTYLDRPHIRGLPPK